MTDRDLENQNKGTDTATGGGQKRAESLDWSQTAWDFVRTGSSFLPKNIVGRSVSAAVYAAHDVDLDAPLSVEAGQALTGALKGLMMNQMANSFTALNPVVRGIGYGLLSRGTDTTLSYSTYFDKTGAFSSDRAAVQYSQLTNPAALASDVVVGVAGYGLMRGSSAAMTRVLNS
jgi:hypothetical protein